MISVTIENQIGTVTLNRPDKHNAFNDDIIEQLIEAFKQVDADESARVLILTAEGKSFSAGADLSWMKSMAKYSYEQNLEDARKLADMLKTLNTLSKPSIAKVQGAAFGGAVGLVSCCDIAIGTTNASFSLSEVKIGLIPATISPYVIAAIGSRAARRFFLTGEQFDASVSLQLGLLHQVCAPDELELAVENMVEILMRNSPQALKQAKALVLDYANAEISDELIEDSSERIANIRTSAEGQEGLDAFLQKRNPEWLS